MCLFSWIPLIHRKDPVKKASSESLPSVRSPETTPDQTSQLLNCRIVVQIENKWTLLCQQKSVFPDKDSRHYVHSICGVHSGNLGNFFNIKFTKQYKWGLKGDKWFWSFTILFCISYISNYLQTNMEDKIICRRGNDKCPVDILI